MTLCSRLLINTILHECHDSIYSGHLSEDRTLEKVKNCAWWPSWRKVTIEYCHTSDRCQELNRSTGKKFGLVIHIQEPKSPWEDVHMDWVTALPPSGDKGYNGCLVIVDRYSKTPIFLPCNKDDNALDTALLLWIRVISHTGLFKNIISDRYPKLTSALWTNIHRFFGTKSSLSTAYHPQTDGLAERMIQTVEDMIRRFCAYGLEFKDSDGFTHDWCTLIPSLALAYKTSVYSSTGKTPAVLEKGWNPRLPADTLRKDLIEIHSIASSFKLMLDKLKHHEKQIELSGELENKHPNFPVSLINPYETADKELFPSRNTTPSTVPPVEQNEYRKIKKAIKERRLRGKHQKEYLVRYRNSVHEDEWLAESEIPDSDKLLRIFIHERRPQA
ncbi:hypothetical protein O181_114726 [Austropuccinia psidii MF-1]|uniref:Integrase catalytic domain-containing protein n=1 Tax=Austropuccinia psidii MF-1 TaxID=1389203 RepID=A0A9Q3K6R0_9BASI|nr:hypothetical protein [Austropuccinia psidii MF-1]